METNNPRLTLAKIGEMINRKNRRSIMKWLIEHDISFFSESKEIYAYKIDVELQINMNYVKSIKRKYPHKWKKIYRVYCEDDRLYNLTLIHLEDEINTVPTTKVRIKSKEDEKIYKKLVL
jgi:hypothetical protein